MSPDRGEISAREELLLLQQTFFSIISRPLLPKSKMEQDARSDELIGSSDQLSAHERLELYAQQYWWRLLDSLGDDFPGVRGILGKVRFKDLLVRYLSKHPSRSFTLRHLGRALPGFLRRDRSLPADMRRKAWAVADIEWAMMEAFERSSLPLPSAEELQGDLNSLRFTLQPFVLLRTVNFSVDEYLSDIKRQLLRNEASNVRPVSTEEGDRVSDTLTPGQRRIIVFRHAGRVAFDRVSALEWDILECFSRGCTIPEMFEGLLQRRSRLPEERIQQAFQRFSSLGWLGIDRPQPDSNSS